MEALIQRGYLREFLAGKQSQTRDKRGQCDDDNKSPSRLEQCNQAREPPTEIRTIIEGNIESSNRALKAHS